MKVRALSLIIYIAGSVAGILAFIYPFLLPALVSHTAIGEARTAEMPLLLTLLLGLSLMLLLFEVQGQAVDTKLAALLGVLVAINAALRFIEIAIPGPGGFSPIFFLIILTGYVYGGRFGFLMGALTMLVSALVTGGIGPWLPAQMLAAGWTGMSAPLIRLLARPLKLEGRTGEVFLLATFGALWGLLYGGVMNLWTWPFISGVAGQSWQSGANLIDNLARYAAYYLVTSLFWDAMRAAGNFAIILAFAGTTLRALRRFQRRFSFHHYSAPEGGLTGAELVLAETDRERRRRLPPERAAGSG